MMDEFFKNKNVSLARDPGFLVKRPQQLYSYFKANYGSADMSPVIYDLGQCGAANGGQETKPVTMAFCRNALTDDVYGAAALVLNLASAPATLKGKARWKTFRLFPQGIPPLEAALEEIIKWVKAIAAGLQGFADIIIAFIEFLQARILEMTALIVRINALLDSLSGFILPAVSGLVVTANGTDGILQGLVTADNKPSDSSDSFTVATTRSEKTYGTYGGGVVLLAGGLPAILIEILKAFFPEADA